MKDSKGEQILSATKVSGSYSSLTLRDGYIDFCKGLLILWVINIHTLFWSGQSYIPEIYRQVSLIIDVPVFLFISGYLTKTAKFIDAFKRSLRQLKHLYFSYLTLSIVLLPILSIAYFLKKKIVPDLLQAIILMLSVLKLEPEAVGGVWGVVPVYRGSFWYIWVYFSVLFFVPFLIQYFRTRRSRLTILTLLLLLLYVSRERGWNFSFFLSESIPTYYYLFIYLLGLAYAIDGKIFSILHLKISLSINILVCSIVFFVIDDRTLSIQAEKFPPSFKYLAYSLLIIHVFIIFQRTWDYPNSPDRSKFFDFVEWCGKNSYFIYLFQGLVCSIPSYFIESFSNRFSTLTSYSIVLIFNVCLTLLCTFTYLRSKSILCELLDTKNENIKSN